MLGYLSSNRHPEEEQIHVFFHDCVMVATRWQTCHNIIHSFGLPILW